jgi:hypothetical protein
MSPQDTHQFATALHADLQQIPSPPPGEAGHGFRATVGIAGMLSLLTPEDLADIGGLSADALGHLRGLGVDAMGVLVNIVRRKLGPLGGLIGGR